MNEERHRLKRTRHRVTAMADLAEPCCYCQNKILAGAPKVAIGQRWAHRECALAKTQGR